MNDTTHYPTVGTTDTVRLTFTAMFSQIVSRGRLIAMAILTALALAIAAVMAIAGTGDSASGPEAAAQVALTFGLTTIVPMISLVLASASLGASHYDGTLVYLWLRPMGRMPIAVGGWAASYVAAVGFNTVALVGSGLILRGGSAVTVASLAAAIFGTAAYTALFGLFALVVRNAMAWGLVYVLVWEGVVGSFGTFPAQLSIHGYTSSLVANQIGDASDYLVYPTSTALALVVLIGICIGTVALSGRRLNTADIE